MSSARETDLRDGRHPVRLISVNSVHRNIVVDVVQFFMGQAAATAAAEDHSAEVPPPNDVWIRNVNPLVRTLSVTRAAVITVNVFGAPESGSSVKNIRWDLKRLAAVDHPDRAVFWITLNHGQVTTIAQQYLP